MAVPKKRSSKSKTRRRRQHLGLKTTYVTKCRKCGKIVLPHTVCSYCGNYRDKAIIDVFGKLDKKEKKKREKEIKQKEKKAPKNKPLSIKELSKK